jgi:sugar phosphate isomerase/epimerase
MHPPAARWSASAFNAFDPRSWGIDSDDYFELVAWARSNRDAFWPPLLDQLRASGATGLDLGMEPADWREAVAWAGSAEAFARELAVRGLRLSGSYQSGHGLTAAVSDASTMRELEQDIAMHADFVARVGGHLLLLGSPLKDATTDDDQIGALSRAVEGLGRIARERGVSLAIHTEAYALWTSPSEIDRLMASTDPDAVALVPDTGHIALQGDDPMLVLRAHLDRIPSVHVKDTRAARPEPDGLDPEAAEVRMLEEFCVAGEGIVDWRSIVELLVDRDYRGWLVAEVDNAPDPAADTRRIIDHVNELGAAQLLADQEDS